MHRYHHRLRFGVQLVFLAFFAALAVFGRLQLWLPVFLAGVAGSFLFSRFYCGWICPMHTLFRATNWLKRTLHIPQLPAPRLLTLRPVRWGLLVLFVGYMVVTIRLQLPVEPLLAVTAVGLLVTLFFHESVFHNYICPYGSLLSLSTRPAPLQIRIDENACIACGKCQPVCPTKTIVTLKTRKRRIDHRSCLTCSACSDACPVGAITYRTADSKEEEL